MCKEATTNAVNGADFLKKLQEQFGSDDRVKSAVKQYLSNPIPVSISLSSFQDESNFRIKLYDAYRAAYPEDTFIYPWADQNRALFGLLQTIVFELLGTASSEDDCTKSENELIAELANLADVLFDFV